VKRFESLDGLRGVCASIVVLFHCDTVLYTGHLFNHGYLCVDVFFVLSGFVIALTYEPRLRAGTGAAAFLKARCRRLLPVHFIGTGIVSLTAASLWAAGFIQLPGFTYPIMAGVMLLGMLMIPQRLVTGDAFPLNSVLWSLWGEWLANIVYALGVYAVRTSILIALVAIFWGITSYYAFHNPFGWMMGITQHDMTGVVGRSMGGFLAGVCLFRAYQRGYLARLPSLSPELLFAAWLIISAMPAPTITPAFDMIAVIVVSPLLIALLIRSDKPMPKIFVKLGALSYPLYASHLAFIAIAAAYFQEFHASRHILYAVPITAASLILAWAINRITARKSSSPAAYRNKKLPGAAPDPA